MSEAIAQALIARLTQETRFVKLQTPSGANQLLAECVRVEECLSQAFTLHIGRAKIAYPSFCCTNIVSAVAIPLLSDVRGKV